MTKGTHSIEIVVLAMVKLLSCCLLLAISASGNAEPITLYSTNGNECIEVTMDEKSVEYAKSFDASGFTHGTCSDNGFSVEVIGEEASLHIPFVSDRLTFKRMRRSSWELAKVKAEAFLAAPLSFFPGPDKFMEHSPRQTGPKPLRAFMGDASADDLIASVKQSLASTAGAEASLADEQEMWDRAQQRVAKQTKDLEDDDDLDKDDEITEKNGVIETVAQVFDREDMTSIFHEAANAEGSMGTIKKDTGSLDDLDDVTFKMLMMKRLGKEDFNRIFKGPRVDMEMWRDKGIKGDWGVR